MFFNVFFNFQVKFKFIKNAFFILGDNVLYIYAYNVCMNTGGRFNIINDKIEAFRI